MKSRNIKIEESDNSYELPDFPDTKDGADAECPTPDM